MEFASTILGPVVDSLTVHVKKHMGYLFLSTEHVWKMNDKMKQLEGTFNDVKNHKDTNDINTLEIPARVPGWLEDVAKIMSDAETISSNVPRCLNIKARYKMGRDAWRTTTKKIEPLLQEVHEISWTNAQKPLGRVYTRRASTSAPSSVGIGDDFKSRDTTFKDALKFLQQDQKIKMIAICGMGGVGKTTMMEQLKKVVEDKKMFDWIVKVVIGKQPNWHSIQKAVAENFGLSLTEDTETTRADRLHRAFEETSEKSEKGILVILDDVWEKVELRNVGLSPLPNGVKLLLTSRYEDVCKTIAVEGNLVLKVLKVNVLEDEEAHKFFCQITNISEESDPELYQIGGDIVKKCSCLPLAIKLIATTLISEEKSIWKDSLGRLRNNDLDKNVHEIIKISYNYLKDQEDKEIFLLCGLFPEDSNIPIEDLTGYAWGLKLLNKVSTMGDGRYRINKCVRNLKNANLLIDSDFPGCVKMHDLVLAFVLDTVSNGDHASIINHGEMVSSSSEDMRESCKRIPLTCKGMCEFPEGFKYPNLSLLKLMDGDDSFKFPQGFYENTEKLEVIAYEKMQYPLLPTSLQCSTNLRILCLHQCSLMFDISFIGDLSNLEVLKITECNIRHMSSTIGKLKKLKVLDLTGCLDLLIDDGVLKSLVNLEELYMIVSYKHAIRLTDANVDELEGCSKNLTALAIEFNVMPKNISFKKLERFMISLGCNFEKVNDQNRYKFENTLKLVTDKCEILESRMTELFEKTEVLHFQVSGVNDLGDGLAESLHNHQSSFYNLRVLDICKCANLRYLFTVHVANGLRKLERLTISLCPILETVVDDNKGGVGVIKFQALKFLSLDHLPKLKSLCDAANVIELPELMELQLNGLPKFRSIYPSATSSISVTISERQSFLNEEVVIPKLEKLHIYNMENLKEIWPCEFSSGEEVNVCILREIMIKECDNLVNLFPSNPMSLLHHLKHLIVESCGSTEVLFNIDLRCVGKTEEVSSCLRSIQVLDAKNLREVWRIKGANDDGVIIGGFQALETLEIKRCKRFRNIFTPTTTNIDMPALTEVIIFDSGDSGENNELVKSIQEQEINVAFPSYLIHTFHNLHTLAMKNYERTNVVFEIESPSTRELATTPHNTDQPLRPLLPYLKDLYLTKMECMSHVWRCNWNKFFISHKHQPHESSSSFHNLTTIQLWNCKKIKYLFSPLMAKLLYNLKDVKIKVCDVIEEVVSNQDDENEELVASTSSNTITDLFPHLDILCLEYLPNLKRIGGDSGTIYDQSKLPQKNHVAWSLCEYSRKIKIYDCQALPYVISFSALGQMQKLEELKVERCVSLVEVFETQGFNLNSGGIANIDEGSDGNDDILVIPRMKIINAPQLSNLTILVIDGCDLLQHVFTFSTLESLTQLEELEIINCKAMKVIVKEDNEEQVMASKVVVFPRLKSISLTILPNLTSFFLGKNELRCPQLADVKIVGCPQMMMFTSGCSITPKLNRVCTELGVHHLECGLNFPVQATCEIPVSSLDTTNSCVTASTPKPWSFYNLIIMNVEMNVEVKSIIPSNELLQLKKLENIYVDCNEFVEEVFEVLDGTGSCDLQSVVKIPELREAELRWLDNLKYLWRNNPWMVLEFPNLTRLIIDGCDSLEYVFTSSMVGSLLQLQDLHITSCDSMEVVVKEANVVVKDECDGKDEIITLPRLKCLELNDLRNLKGFCFGKEAFSWPSLDTVDIQGCPAIRVFTKGDLVTPELKVINTSFGRCELVKEEDLNSFINTKRKEGLEF